METLNQEIFENLGRLFYSIAKDQDISLLGFGELKMLMQKDWMGDQTTPFPVSEATHLIVTTIDSLQADEVTSEQAFTTFTEFYRKHIDLFTEKLKEEILVTVNEIARIFITANRNQNNHIIKLKLLWQNSSLVM